jgi:glycine hydroxymethyltransferase
MLGKTLAEYDPEVHAVVRAELSRRQPPLEMIPSANFGPVSLASRPLCPHLGILMRGC